MSTQGTNVDYQLHSLGWKAFQDLCNTIASHVWDKEVQSFSDSNDAGRDGAFYSEDERIVIQCKFTVKEANQITLSNLEDELSKATALAKKGFCDQYYLMTTHTLSGANEQKIKEAFEKVPGINKFLAFGKERICSLIRENKKLRSLVPRIYGLGDLGEILDERARSQAMEVLSSLGGDLDKFVITKAFHKAANALEEEHFVMLLGEPACGKSTIAATLCMGAIDQWGCDVYRITDAKNFKEHSNPNNKKQVFWIDDAFGANQLEEDLVNGWNRTFPEINAAIKRGAYFIFTSRDYIYKASKRFLKETALPILKESQVVIEVEDLELEEKEQILYNHIKLGNQPANFKKRIQPTLEWFANDSNFSPEVARRLGLKEFTKNIPYGEDGIKEFVKNPMGFLKETFQTLSAYHKAAFAILSLRGGKVESPIQLEDAEKELVNKISEEESKILSSFAELQGSFVNKETEGDKLYYKFKHPTMWDAFSAYIGEEDELLKVYIKGSTILRFLKEISSARIANKVGQVFMPDSLYDEVFIRIEQIDIHERKYLSLIKDLIANRSSKKFIEVFLYKYPNFLDEIDYSDVGWHFLECELVNKLRKFDLLPEKVRAKCVEDLSYQTKHYLKVGVFDEDISAILTKNERGDLLKDIEENFSTLVEEQISDLKQMYEEGEDPEYHFQEYCSQLDIWEENTRKESPIHAQIKRTRQNIEDFINEQEEPEEADHKSYYRKDEKISKSAHRSLFDDVHL